MIFEIKKEEEQVQKVILSLVQQKKSVIVRAIVPGYGSNDLGVFREGRFHAFRLNSDFIKASGVIVDENNFIKTITCERPYL